MIPEPQQGLASDGGVDSIVRIICEIGGIEDVSPTEDFYDAGFTSIGSLELLVQLEEVYSISLSDDDFIKARTPIALFQLVSELREDSSQ